MNPWKPQPILRYPSPALSIPIKPYPFDRSKADDVFTLSQLYTMLQASCPPNGAALAANQIGRHVRAYYEKATDKLIVNPVIVSHGEAKVNDEEGCLSFPGVSVKIKRWKNVVLRYQDEFGMTFEEPLDDFRARVAQHEIEHLDGKTFLDRFDFRKRQQIMAGKG